MDRLKRRADFLAAQAGRRTSLKAFVLQAAARADAGPARIGFTVTRKVGTATERNRIRRRLREAVRRTDPLAARAGFDYVLVARRDVLTRAFADLVDDLGRAFDRIHAPPAGATSSNRA